MTSSVTTGRYRCRVPADAGTASTWQGPHRVADDEYGDDGGMTDGDEDTATQAGAGRLPADEAGAGHTGRRGDAAGLPAAHARAAP
ncbi:hypothetical protein ADL04_22765 [Streptomyces sp. NRRL B-3648]|nr:hypothetical protein ADL04_22765 [Streptomyces sp. NRRL B-3648]